MKTRLRIGTLLCSFGLLMAGGCTSDYSSPTTDRVFLPTEPSSVGTMSVASTSKVPMIDACAINPVFCGADGTSDVPNFESGFAVLTQTPGRVSSLTLQVKGSIPNDIHKVLLCPGQISNLGGFQNCTVLATFTTNDEGHGAFHATLDGTITQKVVEINVDPFATVLTTCPDEPNADCDSAPLQ